MKIHGAHAKLQRSCSEICSIHNVLPVCLPYGFMTASVMMNNQRVFFYNHVPRGRMTDLFLPLKGFGESLTVTEYPLSHAAPNGLTIAIGRCLYGFPGLPLNESIPCDLIG